VLREKGEERLYSLADPNWNVVAICDANGDIQERYTYDAFGKRNVFDENFTAKNDTEFNWNRAFNGQVLDGETGLMLYRMRYYDVVFGRFVNRDPIEYWAGDMNLCRYVANRSVNVVDPSGLFIGPIIRICADIYDTGSMVKGYSEAMEEVYKIKTIMNEHKEEIEELLKPRPPQPDRFPPSTGDPPSSPGFPPSSPGPVPPKDGPWKPGDGVPEGHLPPRPPHKPFPLEE
jgi:RHS repeat-associated protein